MKQITKPNDTNNITSLNKDNNIIMTPKEDKNNVLGSFYFSQWSEPKEIKALIKNIEGQVRHSNEYKKYIGHLNNEIGLHYCSVFSNISDEDEGVTLEFHHYPFTLYDIVEACINKRIIEDIPFTSFDIIDEVLKLHGQNLLGLVKLSKTAHELVHAGKIFIKLESIFGDVNQFVKKYKKYIAEENLINFNKLIDLNKEEYEESIIKV